MVAQNIVTKYSTNEFFTVRELKLVTSGIECAEEDLDSSISDIYIFIEAVYPNITTW